MKGRVSVITPTYNRPRWLLETIKSVLAQTYSDIEIIIVNDGSTDNTEQILEPYMDKIVYIYKENGGQGSAVNAGIAAATGEYIARVDDDDLFMPEKVELQVEMFRKQPALGLVATDCYIVNSEGKIVFTRTVPDFSRHRPFFALLQRCLFSPPTPMVRKKCYEKAGLYGNIYGEDYDMWLRIARHYPMSVVHKALAMYRRHDSNLSEGESRIKGDVDIRAFICKTMDTIPLEELLPVIYSFQHARDVRGSIFLRHDLYKRAGREFYEAVKAEPQDTVHRFWSGILLRRLRRYQDADECFNEIPSENRLYDDSQNARELTSRVRSAGYNDEAMLEQLRRDLSEEHSKLMDMTIALATGQLQ